MRTSPRPVSTDRLARLIVCAQAMLVWAAAVWFGALVADRRRMRQRYGLISLDKLARLVRNLMIARAGQIFPRPARRRRRHQPPPGFRRRARMRCPLRSVAGSKLRRFLNSGDAVQRFARLTHVLRNLDAFVRAFFERRARNGVNRLLAIVAAHPPHEAVCALAAPAPACADTS